MMLLVSLSFLMDAFLVLLSLFFFNIVVFGYGCFTV